MKSFKSDFMLIRWNVLAIGASLLISVIAVYSSGEYADRMQQERHSAQRQLNDVRSRLNTAHEDQKNMAIYAGEYGTLIERKIIGDEHRLDWMEGLERIRQQNLVTDFRYNIAPQKVYAPQPGIDSGNFEIHYSDTKIQLDLLHEGQLLDFFSALRKQIKGQYVLEGCTLKRPAAGDNEDATPASAIHLTAECSGGWVTLKNRNAPQ